MTSRAGLYVIKPGERGLLFLPASTSPVSSKAPKRESISLMSPRVSMMKDGGAAAEGPAARVLGRCAGLGCSGETKLKKNKAGRAPFNEAE